MLAFAALHPWITAFVVLTAATALYAYVTGGPALVKSDAGPVDFRAPVALLAGLLWPFYWPIEIAIRVFGASRVAYWAARQGRAHGAPVSWSWSPVGSNLTIPGCPQDYPPVPPKAIRAGRLVGAWGVLLVTGETTAPQGAWGVIATRPGLEGLLGELYPTEAEARQAFRWLRESQLNEEWARIATQPPQLIRYSETDRRIH